MPSLELRGVLGTVTPRSLYKLPVLWYSVCVLPVPGSRAHVTHDTWTPEHCALNTETGVQAGGVSQEPVFPTAWVQVPALLACDL